MSLPIFPRTPRLDDMDVEALREQIRQYFHATFSRYEQLFEVLSDEAAWYQKPIALRHPLIFYFGHTATFFVNKLLLAGLIDQRIDAGLESLFAVGVDEMSWDDLDEVHYDWPTLDVARAYRDAVRARVDAVIANAPLTVPVGWDHPWWVILMGIEHERIHLETSSVLIRQQNIAWVRQHPAFPACRESGQPPVDERVPVPAGTVRIGKRRDDPYYGWDNEYGEHEVTLPAFETSRHLVSNALFLDFVQAGGYLNDAWWDEEGLAWRMFARAQHPEFWVAASSDSGGASPAWKLRLMTEEVPMPWDWPVEVNFHEARAWCHWYADKTGLPVRLPTEAEWYRLYDVAGVSELPDQERGQANLHLDWWASSCPVTRFAHGQWFDVVGNVWQWCETPIHPFAGFEVHPCYDDFTVPTFDGRHNLIKGGSWISCGNEARRSARYAFRRHFFQHAGFRYVVSNEQPVAPALYYETDRQLSEYAEFHYGDTYFGVDNFPRAMAELALAAMQDKPMRRAMDLGCAVGRASFELARAFDAVVGVDFSARFIQLGVALAQHGSVRYSRIEEGDINSDKYRTLAELGLEATQHRVHFMQGDACNLKETLHDFDLILAANLIDRLYRPAQFLRDVHTRLVPGGLLVLSSPYTWMEDYTPRADWLGGFRRDGENVTGLDGLKAILSAHFRLVGAPRDVPFVIRETRRKFQHSVAQVTVWERID